MGPTDLTSRFDTRTWKVASRSAIAKVNSSRVLQATAGALPASEDTPAKSAAAAPVRKTSPEAK